MTDMHTVREGVERGVYDYICTLVTNIQISHTLQELTNQKLDRIIELLEASDKVAETQTEIRRI